MTEKEIIRVCSALKKITLKPIIFGDIKLELLDIKRAKHAPNCAYATHHHPWFEFNYFSSGSFTTEINGKVFICKKGQSLLIPPGVAHSQISGPRGDDGICMRWQITPSQNTTSEKTYRFIEDINKPRTESLNINIAPILYLGESNRLNSSAFAHFVFSIFDSENSQSNESAEKQLISNQAILYLEEYLGSQITSSDVAAALNMSYRTLARTFKKETGISIIEKLNELRINKARKLLLETDMPVSKIAEAVGYMNVYYFSNNFKKYTRYSPTEFRKSNTK